MKKDEGSNFNILATFILLVLACLGYVFVNNYIDNAGKVTKDDTKSSDEMSDADVLSLGEDKYYLAIATLTNTSTGIDKVYDEVKTTSIVLTDQNIIDSLNSFNTKTYAANSSADIVSNYDEAIKDNFTDDFIKQKIIYPGGFLGNINGDYYFVKDKTDNYFFKSAKLSLVSKSDTELHFTVVTTSYSSSCAQDGSAYPSITCTSTSDSSPKDFILVKDSDHWKISVISL